MQGQAHNIDDLGAPYLVMGDLSDNLVAHFYRWKNDAKKNNGGLPLFSKWDGKAMEISAATTAQEMSQGSSHSVVNDQEVVDGRQVGTYCILKSYSQMTLHDKYSPVNYKMYKPLLDMDQMFCKDVPGKKYKEDAGDGRWIGAAVAASMVGTATVGAAVAQSMGLLPLGFLHF